MEFLASKRRLHPKCLLRPTRCCFGSVVRSAYMSNLKESTVNSLTLLKSQVSPSPARALAESVSSGGPAARTAAHETTTTTTTTTRSQPGLGLLSPEEGPGSGPPADLPMTRDYKIPGNLSLPSGIRSRRKKRFSLAISIFLSAH